MLDARHGSFGRSGWVLCAGEGIEFGFDHVVRGGSCSGGRRAGQAGGSGMGDGGVLRRGGPGAGTVPDRWRWLAVCAVAADGNDGRGGVVTKVAKHSAGAVTGERRSVGRQGVSHRGVKNMPPVRKDETHTRAG